MVNITDYQLKGHIPTAIEELNEQGVLSIHWLIRSKQLNSLISVFLVHVNSWERKRVPEVLTSHQGALTPSPLRTVRLCIIITDWVGSLKPTLWVRISIGSHAHFCGFEFRASHMLTTV